MVKKKPTKPKPKAVAKTPKKKPRRKPQSRTNPKPKSEGQRLLQEEPGSAVSMAAKIGCGKAAIGHWRTGARSPGESARHKLDLLYGIPRRAWDVMPGCSVEEPQEQAPPEHLDTDTLTITKGQISAILTTLRNDSLTDGAAAKLRDTLSKLLALRTRIERDRDLQEDRVVRDHPEWTRIKAAILEALKPYPDAAEAVAKVLR